MQRFRTPSSFCAHALLDMYRPQTTRVSHQQPYATMAQGAQSSNFHGLQTPTSSPNPEPPLNPRICNVEALKPATWDSAPRCITGLETSNFKAHLQPDPNPSRTPANPCKEPRQQANPQMYTWTLGDSVLQRAFLRAFNQRPPLTPRQSFPFGVPGVNTKPWSRGGPVPGVVHALEFFQTLPLPGCFASLRILTLKRT